MPVKVVMVLMVSLLAMSGCTRTDPLSRDELLQLGQNEIAAADNRLGGDLAPLSLVDVLALSLENNVGIRSSAMERALATGNRQLASMAMLPSVTASAGYRNRSNISASVSQSVSTGQVSLEASTSSDRASSTSQLELSWNVLDFSLAYLRARHASDREHIAAEEYRRVVQNLLRDALYAWDRARAYQRVAPVLEALRDQVAEALRQADAIGERRLRDPVLVMEYQKSMLLVLRRINELLHQVRVANQELAGMLGLPPGTILSLTEGGPDFNAPDISYFPLESWQMLALMERPEIRISAYQVRNANRGARERVLQTFPSLMLRYGSYRDSNSFLFNNHWNEVGVSVAYDLVRLVSLPTQLKQAKRDRKLAGMNYEATAFAVLTQTAIAMDAVSMNSNSACLSHHMERIDGDRLLLLEQRRSVAGLDLMSYVRAQLDNVLVRLEYYQNMAEYRQSVLMLMTSVGMGLAPQVSGSDSEYTETAEIIADWLSSGMGQVLQQRLAEIPVEGVETPAVLLGPLDLASCDYMSSY